MFDHEQWVALRAPVNQRRQSRREAMVRKPCVEILAHGSGSEVRERPLLALGMQEQVLLDSSQRVPTDQDIPRTIRAQDEQSRRTRSPAR
jgi:hypothetical protein